MVEKLNIICWKWNSRHGIKSTKKLNAFTAFDVNFLDKMLADNLDVPYQLTCVTDDSTGINSNINIFPIWNELRSMGQCFLRLLIFKPEIAQLFGKRFISIDLDCLIVGNVTELFTRTEDFLILGDHSRKAKYCGSLFMMDSGCRPQVYDTFKPDEWVPHKDPKFTMGSDQAQIAYALPDEKIISKQDGVYIYRQLKLNRHLPENAKIVFFNGRYHPSTTPQKHPWIESLYKKYGVYPEYKCSDERHLNIITCLWGEEYSKEYVEILYRSIERNTSMDFKFWCITDRVRRPTVSDIGIHYMPFENANFMGILPKIYTYEFAAKYLYGKRIFVFDLDTVIVGNLDPLFSFHGRYAMRANFQNANSPGGDLLSFVGGVGSSWAQFIRLNQRKVEARTKGSERAFYRYYTNAKKIYWQNKYKDIYLSYKNHIRKKLEAGEAVPEGCSLISFHGHPLPHEVNDAIIKKHWRK